MRIPFSSLVPAAFFLFLTASCAHRVENYYFGNYSEAERLYNKGEFEKAIQKYQAYIDQNPEGNLAVISLYYMARSHGALGHAEEAKRLYQQIMKDDPDAVWAHFSETQLKELEGGAPSAGPAAEKPA